MLFRKKKKEVYYRRWLQHFTQENLRKISRRVKLAGAAFSVAGSLIVEAFITTKKTVQVQTDTRKKKVEFFFLGRRFLNSFASSVTEIWSREKKNHFFFCIFFDSPTLFLS